MFFGKVVDGGAYFAVHIASIDHQDLILFLGFLALIVKPEVARQASGIEEVIADGDNALYIACFYQLLPDQLFCIACICGGGGHYKARTALIIQVSRKYCIHK